MLGLLLSIPRDVVAYRVVPFLDMISLTRLDSATLSHEQRPGVLTHIFADIRASRDGVSTYSLELIRWLKCRQVHTSGMKFLESTTDADLANAAPVVAKVKYLELTGCLDVTNNGVHEMLQVCHDLQIIVFSMCFWLKDDTVRMLADKNSNLTELHCAFANLLTDSSIIHIVDRCNMLSVVRIDGCEQIGDASIQALSQCKLSHLSIAGCPLITEKSVLALIEKVGSSLKSIGVDENDWLTENVVFKLIEHCPDLQQLSVDGIIVSVATLEYICSHISTTLRELSFLDCPELTDAHIEHIATRASNLTSLTIIHSEQLTNKALITIGKNLSHLHTVKVSRTPLLSYEGFAALAHGCRHIRVLDVSYGSLFCDICLLTIVQNCPQLTELQLSRTIISSRGIKYIAAYCPNLTTIGLYNTVTTDDDMMHLFTSCTKLVRILYWYNNLRELVLQRGKELKTDAWLYR